jgi:hypothetical protein
VKRLALAGLPRILAESDADLFAIQHRGVEQECVDVARVGPRADHIQQPVTAVFVATELEADRPIGVVELGFFGGGEIPVADDVKVGRDRVNDRTPFPFEVEAGGGPDLPIATQQPLALKCRLTTAARRDIPG